MHYRLGPGFAVFAGIAFSLSVMLFDGTFNVAFVSSRKKETFSLPSNTKPGRRLYSQSEDVKQLLDQYVELHSRIMDENDHIIPKRYLLYKEPASGLGNQEISLVSALMFAIITNRALLIYQPLSLHNHFEWPIADWRWENIQHRYSKEYFDKNKIFLEFECCFYGYKPNTTRETFYENLLCSELNDQYPQQFVILWTNQYLVPLMANNPYYRDFLKGLFKNNYFAQLEAFLFHPKPKYLEIVKKFSEQYFTNKYAIGLQIRTANIREGGKWEAIDTFFQCAAHITNGLENVVWFLATDSSYVRELAEKKYPHTIWFEQNITGFLSNHDFTPDNEAARIIDSWLLTECDDVIATIASSFGYVASSRLPNKPPYLVSGYSNTCYKKVTAEPCFHYWEPVKNMRCYDANVFSSEDFNQGKCRF